MISLQNFNTCLTQRNCSDFSDFSGSVEGKCLYMSFMLCMLKARLTLPSPLSSPLSLLLLSSLSSSSTSIREARLISTLNLASILSILVDKSIGGGEEIVEEAVDGGTV